MAKFKINFKDANCQYVEDYSAGKYGTKVKIYFCEGDGTTPKAYSGSVGAKTITADTIEELKKKLDREVASRDKEIAKTLTDSKKEVKAKDKDTKEVLKKLAGKTITEHDLDNLAKEFGYDGYQLWNILRDLAEDGKITKGEKYGEEYFKVPKEVKDSMCVLTQGKMEDGYDDLEDEWDYEINCEGNQWSDGGFETSEEAEDEALAKVGELLEDFSDDYAVDDFDIVIRNTATGDEYTYDAYRVEDGCGKKVKDTDYVKTPRGEFKVVEKTEKELREDGYGYHHSSDDGKYKIFTKSNKAVAIKVKDAKIKDASADDIIDLFKEAYSKGRTWDWLKNKLPSTFLNLYRRKKNSYYGEPLFPIQADRTGKLEGVYLTKPKKLSAEAKYQEKVKDFINSFKDYLLAVDEADEKYLFGLDSYTPNKVFQVIKVAKDKTDSRREFAELDELKDKLSGLNNVARNYAYDIPELNLWDRDYDKYAEAIDKDEEGFFEEILDKVENSWQADEYRKNQRKPIIYNSEGNYIRSDSKVGPLTPEAEAYIRRIMREATTEGIEAKRQQRRDVPQWAKNHSNLTHISEYSDEIRNLKYLLSELKQELNREKRMDINVSNRKHGFYKYTGKGNLDYSGRWRKDGGYEFDPGTQPTTVEIDIEGLENLEYILAKILNSGTVDEVEQNLQEALEVVKGLPRNNPEVAEIRAKINALLNKRKNAPKRRRNLPDKKFVKSRKVE